MLQILYMKDTFIKKGSTLFLKLVVCVIGLLVLALCIFGLPSASRGIVAEFPGGLYSPIAILIGLYLTAMPFFIALVQTMRLLRFIDKDTAFSEASVKALRVIKYCAVTMGVLYAAGLPLFFHIADSDDAPGVMLVGMMIVAAPIVIAVFAAVLERLLKNAIAMKAETDLTV
jgi:hypothetical protein